MKKTLIFLTIMFVVSVCFLGCKQQLIIVDMDKAVIEYPSVDVQFVRLIEKKSPIQTEVSIIEPNVYQMTHHFNHIEIQSYNNILPAFDDSVTFTYQYVSENENIPYYLYSPSSAIDSKQQFPLIVWLHGSGEKSVSEETFKNVGLPKVLNNWSLCGFNAYIICPQLAGHYNNGSWNNEISRQHLQDLLDTVIKQYNINPNKIIIMGHSLGGQGCLYMAKTMPEYFKACISLSPYNPGVGMDNVDMPIIGYSEKGLSYAETMIQIWGKDCLTYLPTHHGDIPNMAFNLDENNNNKSDIIEWIFKQF